MAKTPTTSSKSNGSESDDISLYKPLPPKNLQCNNDGGLWREWLLRLPEGYTIGDCNHPNLWSSIQGSPMHAMRKLDRLTILTFDEGQIAEAVVVSATSREVGLKLGSVKSFSSDAHENLYSDGTYRIFWRGNGYGVERIKDGVPMTGSTAYASESAAKQFLNNLYPVRM